MVNGKCSNKVKPPFVTMQNDRVQKIIDRDIKGRITKTYDGFVYRVFDTLGRQIEWYGNYNNSESHSNIHKFVEYRDSIIIAREYVLGDDNKECKVMNPYDCGLTKYYYEGGQLYKREDFTMGQSDNEQLIGHKLIYTDLSPKLNPYIFTLPDYLR